MNKKWFSFVFSFFNFSTNDGIHLIVNKLTNKSNMWPTNRGYLDPGQSSANRPQLQPNSSTASLDKNLLMAADSLRTLFGDSSHLNSRKCLTIARIYYSMITRIWSAVRENSVPTRVDTSLSQMTSRRPPERYVIDYENPNYSRLDRSRLSQMSWDYGSGEQRFGDSPPVMTGLTINFLSRHWLMSFCVQNK